MTIIFMSILRFYAHYSGIYKIVTLKITAWKHIDQHVPISGFEYISYDTFFGFQPKIIAFIVHLDIVEVNRPNSLFPRLKKMTLLLYMICSKQITWNQISQTSEGQRIHFSRDWLENNPYDQHTVESIIKSNFIRFEDSWYFARSGE